MKILAGLALALASFAAQGAKLDQIPPRPMALCKVEAVYGFPTIKKMDSTQICRTGYALEYDNKAKIPIWASYVITPIRATGCFPRTNYFAPDISVPLFAQSQIKDYAKSGFDTGHMVNSGDMRWSQRAEQESFLLTNMAPQLPEFNRGVWKKLEDSTRGWALNRGRPLQVYVGPIYNREQNRFIGASRVTVPHGFWKVVIDTKTREVMIFTFKHEGSKKDLNTFITSLPELQRLTGLIIPVQKSQKSRNTRRCGLASSSQ